MQNMTEKRFKTQSNEEEIGKAQQVAELAVEMRKTVREFGKKLPKEYKKELFEMSDNWRNKKMPSVGIIVNDGTKKWSWKD